MSAAMPFRDLDAERARALHVYVRVVVVHRRRLRDERVDVVAPQRALGAQRQHRGVVAAEDLAHDCAR
jgi:hypothetical protein